MPAVGGFLLGAAGFGAGTFAVGTAAFGGWAAGAAFGSTLIGSMAVKLLTSVALSALSQALAEKPKAVGIKTESTLTGGINPEGFVLGVYATAGQLVCPPMSHGQVGATPNAYLNYVIELGGCRKQTLQELFINGEKVTLGNTEDGLYGLPAQGRFTGYAWVKFYDGTQTVADPLLLAKYPAPAQRPWSASMIGAGISYAVVTFRYNREVYSGFPRVLFTLSGIEVYDPRKDSTAGGSGSHRWGNPATYRSSQNNAVLVYNILRGIMMPSGEAWGGDASAAELPFARWVAAMNVCDVVVSGKPTFAAGADVSVDEEPFAVIAEILKGCGGQLAESGGVWDIVVGAPGLPVFYFTDDDVVISEAQDFTPFPAPDETYNSIAATYVDPAAAWESREAKPYYNTNWEDEDGGRRLTAELSLPSVSDVRQVQRLMRAAIKDHRRLRRHVITLPPDAMGVQPLDIVSWSSESNFYSNKLFEVVEVTRNPRNGVVLVSLRERNPADYDEPGDIVLPEAANIAPVVLSPQSVPGFTLDPISLLGDGGEARRPALKLGWIGAGLDDVRAIEWQVRLGASAVVVATGSTHLVDAGALIVANGILPNTLYQARARTVVRRARSWTEWLGAITANVKLGAADLADEINDTIADAVAEAEAAALVAAAVQADHDALVSGFVGDLQTAFAEQSKRAMATSGGWLVDPTFTDWVSGNLNAANWASRAGTSAYAVEAGGAYGGGMTVSAPSGSAEVQVIASSASSGGLIGAAVSADYAVLELDLEYVSGNPAGVAFRVEWSSDGTTWTRGSLGALVAAYGYGTQYGLTPQPGTRQAVRALWKRPTGVSGYVRARLYSKIAGVSDAQEMVLHYANLRAAQRADIDAGQAYVIASSTPGSTVTYTGAGEAIAGLNSAFSARAGGLEANVTNILGVRADLLTGTAFAALLTQLAVNTGTGLSATVTAQGSAITTLAGNASATYGLRVAAGGISAGLELVAFDNAAAGGGVASNVKINADYIDLVGKVRASSLLVSDTQNLFPDYDMIDDAFYYSDGSIQFVNTTAGSLGSRYLQLNADPAVKTARTVYLPCEVDTEYAVSGGAWTTSAAPGTGTSTLIMQLGSVDGTGAVVFSRQVVIAASTDTLSFTPATVTVVTAANECRMRFVLIKAAGGTGGARSGGWKMIKRYGGNLIVENSITTRHFAAEQIITKDLIVDGAVSKQFFMYYGLQNTWTSTTLSAIGTGISVEVDFATRVGGTNPVVITFNCALYSAGSGTVELVLQRWNGSTWVNHDLGFGELNYTAGWSYPMFRYSDASFFSGVTIVDGTYRVAARKSASGNANFSISKMMVSFQQMNK